MLEKKIRRYKLMDEHRNLTKQGKHEQAKLVLVLLRKGSVKVGLDDVSFEVETMCEKIGCRTSYGRNFYSATI